MLSRHLSAALSPLLNAELYLRKQVSYSVNRIFPFLRLDDLRSDHPWAELDDLELLKSARLYQRDSPLGRVDVAFHIHAGGLAIVGVYRGSRR